MALLLAILPLALPAYAAGPEDDIGVLKRLSPPKPAPEIIYQDEMGEKRVPDYAKNKLTIVHFWGTWCGPCIEELPQVAATQDAYADKGVEVIAIALDDPRRLEKVKEFLAKHKAEALTPYFDIKYGSFKAAKLRGLPTTLFINSKGEQVGLGEGPLDWEDEGTTGLLAFFIKDKK
jgi:thiol-disulfide isomerase/thioredoxin